MTTEDLARRLDRLERRNHRMFLLILGLVVLLAGVLIGRGSTPELLPKAYAQGVGLAESGQVFTTSTDGKVLYVWSANIKAVGWKGAAFLTR